MKILDGDFICNHCKLTSLDGLPNEVGGDFYCYENAVQFSVIDVTSRCTVRGQIFV